MYSVTKSPESRESVDSYYQFKCCPASNGEAAACNLAGYNNELTQVYKDSEVPDKFKVKHAQKDSALASAVAHQLFRRPWQICVDAFVYNVYSDAVVERIQRSICTFVCVFAFVCVSLLNVFALHAPL